MLRKTLVGACLALFLFLLPHLAAAQPVDPLAAGFTSPPESARPHTWWHWMNGNVSKEGITLDLEAMKRAGIGGFQIFQVGSGIPKGPAAYGTPENLAMLQFAAAEADRLGLDFAMHNCPGWSSSGGPWITPELSMQMLVWTETAVTGGQKVEIDLPQPNARQNYYRDALVLAFPTPADNARIQGWPNKSNSPNPPARGRGAAASAPATAAAGGPAIDPAAVLDISDKMDPQGKLTWDAPAGNWTVLRLGHTTTGVQNRPPPDGGAGLECDKFSKDAFTFHFEHFFGGMYDAMKPLAAKHLAGAIIDSYETGLQNWTRDFPQEFQKRAGYDLRKYLPAMTGRVVGSLETSERFLWDVRKVHADLMAENYYGRFQELCHEHGWKAFNEPYDPGNFDEMTVGAYADMPMGEFWQGQPNQHSIKLAASVAHVNGRPVMGAESFTSQSRWTETPYSLKALGDFMYTQGLNRFIFHRFAMQPNPTALPGMTMGPWGGHFDRTNTWFEQGRAWLQYCARCQFMLQQGLFAADLLYFAGEDSPARTPTREQFNPTPPAGYDYDTIDANNILTRVKIDNGRIVLADGMSYRVFVLPAKRTITLPLLRKLRDLVEQGMVLVVAGPKPDATPSLIGYPQSETELKKLAGELWGDLSGPGTAEHAVGRGKVFWAGSGAPLTAILQKIGVNRDFEATSHSGAAVINFIHRRVGSAEVYFVANRGQQSEDLVCTFNVASRQPELWDAATGQMAPAAVYDSAGDKTRVYLRLDPSGSMFVIFRAPAAPRLTEVRKDGATIIGPFAPPATTAPAALGTAGRGGSPAGAMPMPLPPATDPPAIEVVGDLLAWQNGRYELRSADGRTLTTEVAALGAPTEITGPWKLTFPPKRGAPPEITLDKLTSWSDHPDAGVKYFSGTATYTKRIIVPADALGVGRRMFLDLSRVQALAEVLVNGRNLGILWKLPFRTDITDAVRPGGNDLEIRVTNLWPNRLIGDEQQPAENQYGRGRGATAITALPDWYVKGLPKPDSPRITFTTWHHYNADSPLLESGLIGPVLLRSAARVPIPR